MMTDEQRKLCRFWPGDVIELREGALRYVDDNVMTWVNNPTIAFIIGIDAVDTSKFGLRSFVITLARGHMGWVYQSMIRNVIWRSKQ